MKLVVLVVGSIACGSSKDDKPPPKPETPPEEEPVARGTRTKLDKLATVEPYAITKVEHTMVTAVPASVKDTALGEISLRYAATKDGADMRSDDLNVSIKCRLLGHNLAMPETRSASNVLSAHFYPDPYAGVPDACELEWWVKGEKPQKIATACWRDKTLADGACPSSAFPAPTLPPDFGVDFKTVPTPVRWPDSGIKPIQMSRGDLRINALFTVGTAEIVAPEYAVRCERGKEVAKGTGGDGFVNLRKARPGETVYAQHLIVSVDNPLEPSRCELDVLDGKKKRGTFCIAVADGATKPGACTPALGKS